MYGFTVVLKKRNRENNKISPEKRDRQRKTKSYKAPGKYPIKIPRLFPLIFLLVAITLSAVLSSKQAETTAEVEKENTVHSAVTQLYDDDYSFYYLPVITNGIEHYDSSEEKLTDEMIAAVCWSLIDDDTNKRNYEYFENSTVIPEKDVKKRLEELFGENIEFQGRSAEVNGFKFDYKDGSFSFPLTGYTPLYLPELLDLKEEGDSIILTVGALKSSDYAQDGNGNTVKPEPEKKYKIILSHRKNKICITSVEII